MATDRFLEQNAIWACSSIKSLMILAAGHEKHGRGTCRPYEQIKENLCEYAEDAMSAMPRLADATDLTL